MRGLIMDMPLLVSSLIAHAFSGKRSLKALGTYNFAGGLPLFAVMAAVVENGETVAGVIYDPMGDDFLMTERGCGTWQVFPDGRRVRQKFADRLRD